MIVLPLALNIQHLFYYNLFYVDVDVDVDVDVKITFVLIPIVILHSTQTICIISLVTT